MGGSASKKRERTRFPKSLFPQGHPWIHNSFSPGPWKEELLPLDNSNFSSCLQKALPATHWHSRGFPWRTWVSFPCRGSLSSQTFPGVRDTLSPRGFGALPKPCGNIHLSLGIVQHSLSSPGGWDGNPRTLGWFGWEGTFKLIHGHFPLSQTSPSVQAGCGQLQGCPSAFPEGKSISKGSDVKPSNSSLLFPAPGRNFIHLDLPHSQDLTS